LSNEATDGNKSCAEYTTASDFEDEILTVTAAKVFAQAPCRETQEKKFQLVGIREELDSFAKNNLPAILFIDE